MAEIITKDYVLTKLKEILENDEVTPRDRLQAIKLAGEYLKLFGSRMEIDIRALLAQIPSKQLKGLTNVGRIERTFTGEVAGEISVDCALPEYAGGDVHSGADMGGSSPDQQSPDDTRRGRSDSEVEPEGH